MLLPSLANLLSSSSCCSALFVHFMLRLMSDYGTELLEPRVDVVDLFT